MNYGDFPAWLARVFPMSPRHKRAIVRGVERVIKHDRRAFTERHGGVLFVLIEDTPALHGIFLNTYGHFRFAGRNQRTVYRNQAVYLELPGRHPSLVSQDIETAFQTLPAGEMPVVPPGVKTVVLVTDGNRVEFVDKVGFIEFQKRFTGARRLIILFAGKGEVPEWMRDEEEELASEGINWFEHAMMRKSGGEVGAGDGEEI